MNYYRVNFVLKKKHNFSIDELDDVMPFEKEIYVALIIEQQEKERQNKNG